MNTDHPSGQVRIASRGEWRAARIALLEKEKALTAMKDALAAERRSLPWVRIDKDYIFDAANGPVTLSDPFGGRSQLFIKHFMMGPGQSQQCVGCSLEVDHLTGIRVHLEHHDVTYAVVARAPIEEIEQLKRRMGWDFTWVSSYRNDFNFDFNVSFTDAEIALGLGRYNFRDYAYLDVTPKGRAENGPYHSLPDWVRPHNKYGQGGTVTGMGRYHAADCGCAAHL